MVFAEKILRLPDVPVHHVLVCTTEYEDDNLRLQYIL